MKKLMLAALLFVPTLAHAAPSAGPYVGLGAVFDSISFNAPLNGVVPSSPTGYQVDAGYRFGHISAGAEYTSVKYAKDGNDFASSRFGVVAAYHVPIIEGLDTYLAGGVGRSTFHADGSTFANGKTTTSRLFGGTDTDWNVGVGAIGPVYGALKFRVTGRYQPTSFGGRANSGMVFGIGLALAR